MLALYPSNHRIRSRGRALPVLALFGLLLVVGCSGEREGLTGPDANFELNSLPLPEDEMLNKQVRLLVEAASEGQGLDFFKLPSTTDLNDFPQDPLNPLNPTMITIGMYLFVDPGLGTNNIRPEGLETYSCGSCHPLHASHFANVPQGIGEGGEGFGVAGETRTVMSGYDSSPDAPDVQAIRVPGAINLGFQDVVMWDGKLGGVGPNIGTESQWLVGTPLESNFLGWQGVETQAHAGQMAHRLDNLGASSIPGNAEYTVFFSLAYPSNPVIDRENIARSIAAFERFVVTNQAPFQLWLHGKKDALTTDQLRGAALFFGKGGCVDCHTGPALTSMEFHAYGMDDLDGSWDIGKVDLAPFSGTVPADVRKGRGGFTGNAADDYKFKVPQLYNLKDSPYYGHGASFSTIRQVIEYKNLGVPENVVVPGGQLAAQFTPLGLTTGEITWLTDFVENALYDPNMMRYFADHVPTLLCFPSNDPISQVDLGCGGSGPEIGFRNKPHGVPNLLDRLTN